MPIQPENKIFPHIVPPLPERSGNLLQDLDQLYNWIFDQQKSLDELNRQVVDKYNLHINGTHSHPKSWAKWRLRRPGFSAATSGGTTVTVSGSAAIPSLFVINGELFEVTSNLTCNLSSGGLDTGSIAANTAYYLYGVKSSSTVALIASATDPSTGPTGYTAWTYLGGFCTDEGSAVITAFNSSNGFYIADDEIEAQSSASVTPTTEVFQSLPVTAKSAYFYLRISGTVAGGETVCSPISGAGDSLRAYLQVSGVINDTHGFCRIDTAQTVYLNVDNASNTGQLELYGFIEDPTEYK